MFVLLEPSGAFFVNYLTKNMVAVWSAILAELQRSLRSSFGGGNFRILFGCYCVCVQYFMLSSKYISGSKTQRPRSLLLAFPTIYGHINLLLQITRGVVFQVVLQIITNLC